jgi:hypothetical protein
MYYVQKLYTRSYQGILPSLSICSCILVYSRYKIRRPVPPSPADFLAGGVEGFSVHGAGGEGARGCLANVAVLLLVDELKFQKQSRAESRTILMGAPNNFRAETCDQTQLVFSVFLLPCAVSPRILPECVLKRLAPRSLDTANESERVAIASQPCRSQNIHIDAGSRRRKRQPAQGLSAPSQVSLRNAQHSHSIAGSLGEFHYSPPYLLAFLLPLRP